MITVEELERTRQNLIADIETVDIELTSLRDQIERAKTTQAATGKFAECDWWVRVNSRLRHRGRDRQALQLRLGTVNRELKATKHRVNEALNEATFVSVARERLPAGVFAELAREVAERKGVADA